MKISLSFSIRATASMGGGRSVDVAVDNLSATADEMPFAARLVEAVRNFSDEHSEKEVK